MTTISDPFGPVPTEAAVRAGAWPDLRTQRRSICHPGEHVDLRAARAARWSDTACLLQHRAPAYLEPLLAYASGRSAESGNQIAESAFEDGEPPRVELEN